MGNKTMQLITVRSTYASILFFFIAIKKVLKLNSLIR